MAKDKKSQESQEGGNNQPPSLIDFESRKYVFTLNNYDEKDIEKVKNYLNDKSVKWIFGKEVGEKGTPHLQGYMEYKYPKKWSTICNGCDSFKKAWSTKARGSMEQNISYTTKEGDYYHGGFNLEKAKYKVDIELYEWQKKIMAELENKPDDRTINWIWEPKGCAGKTTFQKYVYTNCKNVAVLSGKSADMKNGIVQFIDDKGETPDIVLINIPRCNQDYVSYEGIESIKDMFFFSGKYEGGMVCGANPHVYIFANEPPPVEKLSKDRWNIIRI